MQSILLISYPKRFHLWLVGALSLCLLLGQPAPGHTHPAQPSEPAARTSPHAVQAQRVRRWLAKGKKSKKSKKRPKATGRKRKAKRRNRRTRRRKRFERRSRKKGTKRQKPKKTTQRKEDRDENGRWLPPYLRYITQKYVGYFKQMRRLALKRLNRRRVYPYRSRRVRTFEGQKELAKKIENLLKHRWLRGAKLGVVVMHPNGEILFQQNATRRFIPASNVKLLTIAAALHYLGPAYRYVTKVYADREPNKDGVVRGNLYIKGSGDPSLRAEELWKIAKTLYLKGLRHVTGRIYFDDSLFDREHFGPGWEDHAVQPGERYRAYMSPVGALSMNYNVMGFVIRPGGNVGADAKISLDPRTYYVREIVNKVKTVSGGRFGVRFKMLGHRSWRERIEIKGKIPLNSRTRTLWRRVTYPGWFTAFSFAQLLRDRRIKVHLWPRRGKVPSRARVLHRHYSAPLGVILQYAGKISSNFTTEQVTKLMGAKLYQKPGTWAKGVNAIRSYLKSIGIAPNTYKLLNGSGLSRGNRLYPLLFAKLLQKQLTSLSTRPDFIVSQPIAGYDGTLRWRMKRSSASGVLRAKTGTLDGVSSLSGYVETADKQLVIFAINMNGRIQQIRYFRRIQNRIGKLLARYRLGSRSK